MKATLVTYHSGQTLAVRTDISSSLEDHNIGLFCWLAANCKSGFDQKVNNVLQFDTIRVRYFTY